MIAVRPASPDDVDGVLALWQALDPAATPDAGRRAVHRLLAHDPHALLLATEGGRLLGTVVVGWDGWRGQIHAVAVDPQARRAGVTRTLLQAAERRLAALGADAAEADAPLDDPVAAGLWQGAFYAEREHYGRWVKPLL